jgi:hypothetical protein
MEPIPALRTLVTSPSSIVNVTVHGGFGDLSVAAQASSRPVLAGVDRVLVLGVDQASRSATFRVVPTSLAGNVTLYACVLRRVSCPAVCASLHGSSCTR